MAPPERNEWLVGQGFVAVEVPHPQGNIQRSEGADAEQVAPVGQFGNDPGAQGAGGSTESHCGGNQAKDHSSALFGEGPTGECHTKPGNGGPADGLHRPSCEQRAQAGSDGG